MRHIFNSVDRRHVLSLQGKSAVHPKVSRSFDFKASLVRTCGMKREVKLDDDARVKHHQRVRPVRMVHKEQWPRHAAVGLTPIRVPWHDSSHARRRESARRLQARPAGYSRVRGGSRGARALGTRRQRAARGDPMPRRPARSEMMERCVSVRRDNLKADGRAKTGTTACARDEI